MTTATAEPPPKQETRQKKDFDPDSFRMTVGEHLEELRWRMILALGGFFVAVFGCLAFSERVIVFICAPLISQLKKHDINPQLVALNLTDPFMTYIKITLIAAAAIAGPWMIYQLWLFVAAGLYPRERKLVTRYIPLSVTLFVSGLVFVYMLVLPLSIKFFIEFGNMLPMPWGYADSPKVDTPDPFIVPRIGGDPVTPKVGQMWFNTYDGRLKIFVSADGDPRHGTIRVVPFGPEKLVAFNLQLPEYIDLVITFMLTFGLAFQLPLVLLALVGVGIVEVSWLRKQRKIVYFVMSIAAAFLAPGDIVLSMLSLLIPLMLLYEFGLWLAVVGQKRRERDAK